MLNGLLELEKAQEQNAWIKEQKDGMIGWAGNLEGK